MHCIICCVVVTLPFLVISAMGMQDWNLIVRKFDYNTSDPDLVKFNIRTTRKEPGVYALNGTFDLGVDIYDKFSMEVKVYRSPTGSGQYTLTPFQVPRKEFCEFIKTFYIPMLQDDLKACTKVPVFDDKCDKPIAKGHYDVDMCLISNGGMPSHIQPGFYKIVAQVKSDDLEFWISLFAEAEPKSMG